MLKCLCCLIIIDLKNINPVGFFFNRSMNNNFGSKTLLETTGILLNDVLLDFDLSNLTSAVSYMPFFKINH